MKPPPPPPLVFDALAFHITATFSQQIPLKRIEY